ncbi:MAG: cytochrome ubiquinol oxidase subunit I [Sphingomonadaceae bacterium]
MNELLLARMQFGITTAYHFFFVPLTLGLSILVALLETRYVRTGDETYKRMAQFWGRLFLINFAMGVVTGIVQEFQFGLNWSNYSRFVGDIFGAPLAVEALLAFFLESTFLGLWIFGWDRLPKALHAVTIWLVAIGSNISAFWILVANSFMQNPVGYTLRNGRAEMTDFFALLTNPYLQTQYPHVLAAGLCTAAFFMLGISAYHLRKKGANLEVFRRSFRWAAVAGTVGTLAVIAVGHTQAQHLIQMQPMKMAAAEALWESEDPAGLSLFTWGDEAGRRDVFAIRVKPFLTLLSYGTTQGEVSGIKELDEEYRQKYGPGDYVPSVITAYWSFRAMVGAGFLMLFVALYSLYYSFRGTARLHPAVLKMILPTIALPYVANTAGWLLAEMGRQPWIVYGLMTTQEGVSPTVSAGMVLLSVIGFTLVYGALMVADIYLLAKYAKGGTDSQEAAALAHAY